MTIARGLLRENTKGRFFIKCVVALKYSHDSDCCAEAAPSEHKEFESLEIPVILRRHFEAHTTTEGGQVKFRVTIKSTPAAEIGEDLAIRSFNDMEKALDFMKGEYHNLTKAYPTEEGQAPNSGYGRLISCMVR